MKSQSFRAAEMAFGAPGRVREGDGELVR